MAPEVSKRSLLAVDFAGCLMELKMTGLEVVDVCQHCVPEVDV